MKIYRILLPLLFFAFLTNNIIGQETITFKAKDGLTVTADLYMNNPDFRYAVLFHQAGYSRGEYKETQNIFSKIGYNCLAVDLRSGKEVNFVQNETAMLAEEKGLPTTYLDAEPDMIAAIDYAYEKSQKPVIIVGSSYSASLVLKVAKNNPKVLAVVSFSPGEYFGSDFSVKNYLSGFDKPVFITATQREFPSVLDMVSNIPSDKKTLFKPGKDKKGIHGSRILWNTSDSYKDVRFDLLRFLTKYKNVE
ncbi:MAG: alpha/beta hydrolase [Chlorobi bacterium]|nr:alpha/beta hydrolase [Chlorobiota bacterium]